MFILNINVVSSKAVVSKEWGLSRCQVRLVISYLLGVGIFLENYIVTFNKRSK